MAPLKSLDLDYPIIDPNFQQFCASHGIFSVKDFLIHDLYVLFTMAEQHPTSERLKEDVKGITGLMTAIYFVCSSSMMQLRYETLTIVVQGLICSFKMDYVKDVTELGGLSSSCKTLVCLQVASNVTKIGGVVFLDTGNSFSPKRIAQFLVSDPAGKESDRKILQNVLASIVCYSCLTFLHCWMCYIS
ncbi:DNA repair protein RAD51 homolog 4-like isoform X6 [Actinidia eriantha]|uniref:DNA repair protein RAD51 homolog 4-like isoform X6 n=1 Tax=Actinidia eriantha TaxID=165200 RepID=UPI002582C9F9|nr:DNA repair protein RAD51 homolog 4-like isoform X6 [Actinidia eriantha]XP_057508833.1 DNA repair protein RAD51 homolog 4-like isoform X6 [Actinidia eriantha]XP_057508834.1 DNA repair protein RAD51 homolog 4-like isoform X6 [Actinidia eriantha]